MLFSYKDNLTCIEVYLQTAIITTFPMVFLGHAVPPLLETCSSFAEILHKFFVKIRIINCYYSCKLIETITAFEKLLYLFFLFDSYLSYFFSCYHSSFRSKGSK